MLNVAEAHQHEDHIIINISMGSGLLRPWTEATIKYEYPMETLVVNTKMVVNIQCVLWIKSILLTQSLLL